MINEIRTKQAQFVGHVMKMNKNVDILVTTGNISDN